MPPMNIQHPLKFLIVDDDSVLLKFMGKLLELRGHQVALSHAGTSAILDITEEYPDCLITDLMMAGMDGLELVREIRNSPDLQAMKIIMVTANKDESVKASAIEAGVDTYITKPLDAKTFANQIEAALI